MPNFSNCGQLPLGISVTLRSIRTGRDVKPIAVTVATGVGVEEIQLSFFQALELALCTAPCPEQRQIRCAILRGTYSKAQRPDLIAKAKEY